jgi:hypothetical protein
VAVDGIRGDERLVVNPRDELAAGDLVRIASPSAPVTANDPPTQSAE